MLSGRSLALAIAAATTIGAPITANAQDAWPTRPIKVIVPTTPGSGIDIIARIYTEALAKSLKQPFVVENRAGSNGMLASRVVIGSPNDGYTLLFSYTAAHVVNPLIHTEQSFDPIKDFTPIAQTGTFASLFVVSPKFPAKDLRELVAYAKSRPTGYLAYGTRGVGSAGHLSMEALMLATGLKLRHVPYKSMDSVNQDIVGGHIPIAVTTTTATLPLIEAGQMRPVAVTGTARWRALGIDRMPALTPAQFTDLISNDSKAWAPIVRAINLKPE